MLIRAVEQRDHAEWLRMRIALWPGSPEDHSAEIAQFLEQRDSVTAVFVADPGNGNLVGLLECGSRSYAEGCSTSPVGYVEGWWVDPGSRKLGIGALLVGAAEDWARSQGFTEMASDADLNNVVSASAHRALGYDEAQRIICYRKPL